MARFALVALCAIASVATATGKEIPSPSMKYGMSMVSRAWDAVCWYEYLKVFPETYSDLHSACDGQAAFAQKNVEEPDPTNRNFMEFQDGNDQEVYKMFLNQFWNSIPNEYEASCKQYLEKADMSPASDESDALNDKGGYDYPYKGLAYCFMKTLRDKKGEKAIEAVKNERTHKMKNWMQTLLDRENEFRARHGAPPLKLMKPLVEAAQEWAQENADNCDMHHVAKGDPRGEYQGKSMGESLAASGGADNKQIAAYLAADGWYEEIKDYPWPEYKGDGNDEMFKAIGHFTQSVWKGSEYVGYGYAYNKNCGTYKSYIAGRYFPAGNMPGSFGDNVAKPKD